MIGMGFGIVGILFMLLFWGGLIAGGAWLARALFVSNSQAPGATSSSNQADAHEILDQRYARGEITREQYQMMKQDLD